MRGGVARLPLLGAACRLRGVWGRRPIVVPRMRCCPAQTNSSAVPGRTQCRCVDERCRPSAVARCRVGGVPGRPVTIHSGVQKPCPNGIGSAVIPLSGTSAGHYGSATPSNPTGQYAHCSFSSHSQHRQRLAAPRLRPRGPAPEDSGEGRASTLRYGGGALAADQNQAAVAPPAPEGIGPSSPKAKYP